VTPPPARPSPRQLGTPLLASLPPSSASRARTTNQKHHAGGSAECIAGGGEMSWAMMEEERGGMRGVNPGYPRIKRVSSPHGAGLPSNLAWCERSGESAGGALRSAPFAGLIVPRHLSVLPA
jgi:hypothetical protein